MAHVHYKFSSKLSYDTVVFDGPHTTLSELKRQIMGKEKLRAGDCDLQITNAQTKEEYTVDDDPIPKGSSVIVRRIPIIGARPNSSSKTKSIERSDVHLPHAFGASRAMDGQNSTSTLSFFSKMTNLADADVPEEDKLKVLMTQSICDSMNLTKKHANLPGSYTCYRCGLSGHHIRNCPTIGQDKNSETPLKIKKSSGIPRSFMVEVDDPSIKGAMLTNSGRYAIPAIDAAAYAIGKKEKPPSFVQESESKEDPIPDELLCVICHDLLCDSVVIPCCGNSYCDDCIRTTLLESEDHVCPSCNQSDVSPDTLIANKFLRQAVNNFKKERGDGNRQKPANTQSQNLNPTPKPVPALPLLTRHSLPQKNQHSTFRQQDPLQVYPKAATPPPPLSQVSVGPTATCPASAHSTPSISSQLVQNSQEPSAKDDSQSSQVSRIESTAAPSQLTPLPHYDSVAEQQQTVSVNQQVSLGSSGQSKSSSSLNSSSSAAGCATGSWNESIKQQPTPPSPFPPSIFHTNLLAPQSNSCYPPGYPSPAPIWMPPALQASPIPSLVSPTPSVPNEWYRHQRQERSPHRSSSNRRSSTHSKAKSSSQCYSHSSSHSESRSRSRSKGKSRHRSPYSRRRDHHSRSRPSSSYSFGYKRSHSPTPSSSSSPQGGYQSKSKSPTDHRRNRHHSKRSSSSSRRRGERSRRDAAGTNLQAEQRNQSSSLDLELDRERYLQWKKDYTEWCEKYFSSYVSHFHQLPFPPPLLSLPPACPQWEYKEGSTSHSQASCSHSRTQGRRTTRRDDQSPSSDSSSCSRSPPSHSSSESHSTPNQSPSQSSLSHKDSRCGSPPSQSSSDGLSAQSADLKKTRTFESCTDSNSQLPVTDMKTEGVDDQQPTPKPVEESRLLKQEQNEIKKQEVERRERSSSPPAANAKDESSRRIKTEISTCGLEVPNTLESVEQLLTRDKRRDKQHEKKLKEEKNLESEKVKKRDKDSRSGRVEDERHKLKPRKEPNVEGTRRRDGSGSSRGHDSRSARSRKRERTDLKRNDREESPPVTHQSRNELKTESAPNPDGCKSEHPNPPEGKKQKKEKDALLWTKADIWEGGIKVKPQKKINININLDVKRKDESTDQQDLSNLESDEDKIPKSVEPVLLKEETFNKAPSETEANGKKETSRDDTKPEEAEVAPLWDQTFSTVASNVMLDETVVEDEANEDLNLWHFALRSAEEMDGETATFSHQDHWMDELVTSAEKGEENPKTNSGGGTIVEERSVWGEKESNIFTPQTTEDKNLHERLTTADDNVGAAVGIFGVEDGQKLRNLEENPLDQAADTLEEQVLMEVFHSKWEKEDEEEQHEGEVGAHTASPPVALSQPSVTVTVRETDGDELQQRQRSAEMERDQDRVTVMGKDQKNLSAPNRGVSPPSGKDQSSSLLNSHRDSERDRKRDKERGTEEERKKEKAHRKESEKVRSRERELERGGSVSSALKGTTSSSHSSASSSREREGSSRSSSGATSRRSSTGRSTDLPHQNPKKSFRDTSPAWKSSHQDPSRTCRPESRSAGTHRFSPPPSHRHSKDRDPLTSDPSAGSPDRGWMQNKHPNESKREKRERELNKTDKAKTGNKSGRDYRESSEHERVRKHEEEAFYKWDGESKVRRR